MTNPRTAMEMALKTLETLDINLNYSNDYLEADEAKVKDVIAALQEALAAPMGTTEEKIKIDMLEAECRSYDVRVSELLSKVKILTTQPSNIDGQCAYCGNIDSPDKRNATFQLKRAIKAEDSISEAAEITENFIQNVSKNGTYSKETTLVFLGQIKNCLVRCDWPINGSSIEIHKHIVAWYDEEIDCAYTATDLDGGTADGLVPLYAHPPVQPLSDEEITEAFNYAMSVRPKDASNAETNRLFARAIEAAVRGKT